MPTCNVKVISQFNFKNYGAGFITMRRVIHWFRRDLRVTDNTALWHACDQADEVIPVYILSTWKKRHPWTGPNRQEFLCGCLESLSKNLEAIGGCLILRAGDPVQELEKLVNETHAKAIFFNRGTDPYSVEVQQQLEKASAKLQVQIFSYKDVTIHARAERHRLRAQPDQMRAPSAGFDAILRKPFTPDLLLQVISEVIQSRS